MLCKEGRAIRQIGARKINLDDASERDPRPARIIGHEVIERDGVASDLQALARSHHQVVRFNSLEHCNDRLGRGQEGHTVFQEQVADAVDEGALAAAEHIESQQQRTVERAARRPRGHPL
jgi:hypothetical protein